MLNNITNAPVIAEPITIEGITFLGRIVAKEIAPSVIKYNPINQLEIPAFRSSIVYCDLKINVVKAIINDGTIPPAITFCPERDPSAIKLVPKT